MLSDCGRLPDFSGFGFLTFISTQSRASSPFSAWPLWVREGLREQPRCETTKHRGAPASNGHLGQGSPLTVRSPGPWLGPQRGRSPLSGRGSSPGGETGAEAIPAGQGHPRPHGAQTPPAPWTVWGGRVLARKVTPTLRSAGLRGCGRGECPPETQPTPGPQGAEPGAGGSVWSQERGSLGAATRKVKESRAGGPPRP